LCELKHGRKVNQTKSWNILSTYRQNAHINNHSLKNRQGWNNHLRTLTKNGSPGEHSLNWPVRFVPFLTSDDTVFPVVIFEWEPEQCKRPTVFTTSIAKFGIASIARHMITSFSALNIYLVHKHEQLEYNDTMNWIHT